MQFLSFFFNLLEPVFKLGQRWLGTRDGLLRVDGPWNDLIFSADLDQVVWQIVQWQGSLYAATEGGMT